MRTAALAAGVGLVVATSVALAGARTNGLKMLEQYRVPAIEAEVGGVHPHLGDDGLYYLAANRAPAYTTAQRPRLAPEYRGKLLTVERRSGRVVHAVDLGARAFGGIASDGQRLYVSSLEPPEILVFDPRSDKVERRIPLDGPAGGLAYDGARGRLLAQLYLKHPSLAVVDVKSGATVGSLWSDESAMDLKLVSGDLLCTWASSFDGHAFSELRRIDPATGKVTGRIRLDGIHSSMGPLDRRLAGVDGFISLVTTDKASGAVELQKFAYDKQSVSW